MVITWLGKSCFKLTAKGEAGSDATLIVNPASVKGLTHRADIVVTTNTAQAGDTSGATFVVASPGEYETRGVFLYGVPRNGSDAHDGFIVFGEAEGVSFVFLGVAAHELTDEERERVDDAHVVLIPVGKTAWDVERAAAAMQHIGPRIVLVADHDGDGKHASAEVSALARALGIGSMPRAPQCRVSAKDLPQEDMQVIALDA